MYILLDGIVPKMSGIKYICVFTHTRTHTHTILTLPSCATGYRSIV